MQYLIIENFRDRDPVPVYRRFRHLVEFEVMPVLSSAEVQAKLSGQRGRLASFSIPKAA